MLVDPRDAFMVAGMQTGINFLAFLRYSTVNQLAMHQPKCCAPETAAYRSHCLSSHFSSLLRMKGNAKGVMVMQLAFQQVTILCIYPEVPGRWNVNEFLSLIVCLRWFL